MVLLSLSQVAFAHVEKEESDSKSTTGAVAAGNQKNKVTKDTGPKDGTPPQQNNPSVPYVGYAALGILGIGIVGGVYFLRPDRSDLLKSSEVGIDEFDRQAWSEPMVFFQDREEDFTALPDQTPGNQENDQADDDS